jgi:hypothetical protein
MPGKDKRKIDDRSPQGDKDQASKRNMTDKDRGKDGQKSKDKDNEEDMDMSFDFCERLTEKMDKLKGTVASTLTLMEVEKNPSMTEIKNWMTTLAKAQMSGMDDMACLVSEMFSEMDSMQEEIRTKDKEITKLQEQVAIQDTAVKAVAKTKDTIEIKASSKDMEDRLKVAMTQFKVMDMDIGKETDNRQEIVSNGMKALKDKIRSDMRTEWEKLTDGVEVAPLMKRTAKATGKDFYTAPLLFTVPDRNRRWRMEEILRNSKVFPGFHWPQEMLPVIKGYKEVLKDNGVNEETTYVRIRPNDRDGKVKLRADVKGKEGAGRFAAKASWNAPPLCPELRKKDKDHLKPVWAGPKH